jgi:hypothetical protein
VLGRAETGGAVGGDGGRTTGDLAGVAAGSTRLGTVLAVARIVAGTLTLLFGAKSGTDRFGGEETGPAPGDATALSLRSAITSYSTPSITQHLES